MRLHQALKISAFSYGFIIWGNIIQCILRFSHFHFPKNVDKSGFVDKSRCDRSEDALYIIKFLYAVLTGFGNSEKFLFWPSTRPSIIKETRANFEKCLALRRIVRGIHIWNSKIYLYHLADLTVHNIWPFRQHKRQVCERSKFLDCRLSQLLEGSH